MKYSLKIFRIFNIPVELHISFLILIIAIYLVAVFNVIPGVDIIVAILITLLFISVVLHELIHSYVAQRYGVEIERIVLLPIGGISAMKELPQDPKQELRIALAGPLLNLVLAGILYPIYLFMANSLTPGLNFILYNFILLNLLLGAFNLLPAFPMDGGRILRAFLAERMNFIRATELAAFIGKQLAIIMAIIGIFFNPFLIFIALFVYLGADQESKMVVINTLLAGIKVSDIMTRELKTVKPSETVNNVLKMMFQHKHMGYPVYENQKLLGIITFHDISDILEEKRHLPVEKYMTQELLVTNPGEDIPTILERLNSNSVGRLPVLEDGKLVGIISRTDIMKALELKKSMMD